MTATDNTRSATRGRYSETAHGGKSAQTGDARAACAPAGDSPNGERAAAKSLSYERDTRRPAYWKVTRSAWIERWRFGLSLRIFHGFGLPKFEFEFRLGFPRTRPLPEYIQLEGSHR